jgi:hypothetical protein
MGWKLGLAGLALVVCVAVHAGAAQPGAAYGTFEGRDYILVWPAVPPTRIVVYLHASGPKPLAYESRSGMLQALAADAGAHGYALLAPTSGVGHCEAAGAGPMDEIACWRLDASDDELGRINRLIAFIEQKNAVAFQTRDIVGYELGAQLVVSGLAAGRLESWSRLGLLDGKPPPALDRLPEASARGPLIYLEAPQDDSEAAAQTTALQRSLGDADYGPRICVRGRSGDRQYDAQRTASFLAWFALDCRTVAPPPAPRGGSGGQADGAATAQIREAGEQDAAARRKPQG